jgi:hypothetical protein
METFLFVIALLELMFIIWQRFAFEAMASMNEKEIRALQTELRHCIRDRYTLRDLGVYDDYLFEGEEFE